jgi:hypothetical protein
MGNAGTAANEGKFIYVSNAFTHAAFSMAFTYVGLAA